MVGKREVGRWWSKTFPTFPFHDEFQLWTIRFTVPMPVMVVTSATFFFANNYDFKGMRFKKTPVNDTALKTKKKYLDDRMFSIYDRKGIFVKYSAQSKKQIKFSFE